MKGEKENKVEFIKSHKFIKIITILLVVFIILSVYWLFFRGCDKFPEDYDIDEVVIYYYKSTMIGRYDIVIYGNGSAYYLSSYDPIQVS